ncbi:MAG: cyclase family protein, partial [Flavobacteriales bacterium]
MTAEFHLANGSLTVDLNRSIDLSDPFTDQGEGILAWHVDHPRFTPVRAGNFIGSVKEGGVVNFRDLSLNPHGNGTHTECLGHITETIHDLNELWKNPYHSALLIQVAPETHKENDGPRE